MQTVLVDEEFGDYNEKAFFDVATLPEIWDWTSGVLVPGLFDSDPVDPDGKVRCRISSYGVLPVTGNAPVSLPRTGVRM